MAGRCSHRLHRHAARIRVTFCLPEQGMQCHELLSRATCFAVRGKGGEGLSIFTSGHVASPWLFPKYHENEMSWLRYVKHKDCEYTLLVGPAGGGRVVELPLSSAAVLHQHQERDLAMFALRDGEGALSHFRMHGTDFSPLSFRESSLEVGDSCSVVGYEVEEIDASSDESSGEEEVSVEDTRKQLPFSVSGRVSFRTARQNFLMTSELLNLGMCGSPVIDGGDFCCGLVEGIVPPDTPHRALMGHACFIDTKELRDFIENPSPAIEIIR